MIFFHNPQKFIVYGKKKQREMICGIGMLRQQQIDLVLPNADTAIARDLVSAFGPLLYGPHSYRGS